MAISFSGVGSGLPVGDWIDALMQVERQPIDRLYTQKSQVTTQKTTLTTLESKFSILRSAIEKLTDSNIVSAFDLFNRKAVTSSDSDIATASVSNKASVQSMTLKVNSLATATVAKSTNTPGDAVTGDTTLEDLGTNTTDDEDVTNLSFSLFVNNVKHEYNVAKDGSTTLDEVIQMINDDFTNTGEITALLTEDGKLKIDVHNDLVTDFRAGSSTDTSNFLTVTQLTRTALDPENPATPDNIDYIQSTNPLTKLNLSGKLVSNETNLTTEVTAGTFKIGNAEFTIDANTTLSNLIAEINYDEDSGVTAAYDPRQNKLLLTAKNPGTLAINVEKGTSNFTDVMGLTNENQIAAGSQTLGDNAVVELNGSTIEASTNTLTGANTGITGLTINLLKPTSDAEGEISEVNLSINKNNDDLTSAISNFLTKFNDFAAEVDKQTASSGNLKGEYSLLRLKDELRSVITGSLKGLGDYNDLSAVGITSGKVGKSVDDTSNSLSFDKSKLIDALNDSPENIRALFIGDKTRGITGIIQSIQSKAVGALDPEYGYFTSKKKTFDSKYADLDASITKGEDRLTQTKARLTQQFSQMDQMISQMKSQSSSLF